MFQVNNFILTNTQRWSSWFKAPVLKIGVGVSLPWVRIPPSAPFFYKSLTNYMEIYPSGRRGQFAKLLGFVKGRESSNLSISAKRKMVCPIFQIRTTSSAGRATDS